ncbi:hypothetical protein U1Q18_012064, partial [Sarracenia purpurea var. burkii]
MTSNSSDTPNSVQDRNDGGFSQSSSSWLSQLLILQDYPHIPQYNATQISPTSAATTPAVTATPTIPAFTIALATVTTVLPTITTAPPIVPAVVPVAGSTSSTDLMLSSQHPMQIKSKSDNTTVDEQSHRPNKQTRSARCTLEHDTQKPQIIQLTANSAPTDRPQT